MSFDTLSMLTLYTTLVFVGVAFIGFITFCVYIARSEFIDKRNKQ